MKLIYHSAAETELIGAARFYEEKVPGLGVEFLDEFERSVGQILASPMRWRLVRGDKRRFLLPRFPYGLYYRIVGDEVRLLVIKHHSQHPDHGMSRR